MNWHAGHCHGQFMVKACGKRVHEHEQYIHMSNTGTIARNRLMVRAWSNDGVKGYIHSYCQKFRKKHMKSTHIARTVKVTRICE